MKILVVNDDGILSLGLKILVEQLKPLGEVYIFAPEKHQSGMSQALSLRKKMKVKNYGNLYGAVRAYSVKGTPADCLRLGLFFYDKIKFDLVVSGINQGANLGSDVSRSGTIGAASEAASLGIPAIALSSPYRDFQMSERYTTALVKFLLDNNLVSSDYLLNINFPMDTFIDPKGVMFTIQGEHKYKPAFIRKSFNKYMAIYQNMNLPEKENSDVYCYRNGIISITPIFEDRSRLEFSQKLNNDISQQLNEHLKYGNINNKGGK